MELTNCTAILLGVLGTPIVIGLYVFALTGGGRLKLSELRQRVVMSFITIAFVAIIGTGGSQVKLKDCGEEDSITRALDKMDVDPKMLAVISQCDCCGE
jgi:hypothetical protein